MHHVLDVVDGDTLDVDAGDGGGTIRVRLLGIDTPETVHPSKPVHCYGPEASARAHELLDGGTVMLATDPTQDEHDAYGRLLAYVTLDDGTDVGLKLLEEGYAHGYTYDEPYQRRDAYTTAQDAARNAGRGLWGAC